MIGRFKLPAKRFASDWSVLTGGSDKNTRSNLLSAKKTGFTAVFRFKMRETFTVLISKALFFRLSVATPILIRINRYFYPVFVVWASRIFVFLQNGLILPETIYKLDDYSYDTR